MNKAIIITIIAIVISVVVIGALAASPTSEPATIDSEPVGVEPATTGRNLSVNLVESLDMKTGP